MDEEGFGRRRRWSEEEKRAIVELSLDPECKIAEVAHGFDVMPAQIYRWRVELREAAEPRMPEEDGPIFLPAVIEPPTAPPLPIEPEPEHGALLANGLVQVATEVQGVPVMVAHGASPALVASVIAALRATP